MALVFGPHARTTEFSCTRWGSLSTAVKGCVPAPVTPTRGAPWAAQGAVCGSSQSPPPVPEGAAAGLAPETCLPDCSVQSGGTTDHIPPGFSVHGTVQARTQARTLDWAAMPSRRSSRPRDRTRVSYASCAGRGVCYHDATWEAHSGADTDLILPLRALFGRGV